MGQVYCKILSSRAISLLYFVDPVQPIKVGIVIGLVVTFLKCKRYHSDIS
jgi:hypothetical protein